jgi:UDP-GlcNAc:undecaprenyl-phosphate/decaprenyl-phosphate GlcNAc-1-phosphate transferase
MAYFYLFSTFLITGISLLLLKPAAIKIGLVDIPGGRKVHRKPTPLVGGLGIFLGILCVTISMPGMLLEYSSLLSLSALILFIGTVDDAKNLSPLARLIGHSLVALAMAVVAGVELDSFGALLSSSPLDLGFFSVPVTIFATLGVINAINMSDGVDGLSGALVIVSLSFIALTSSMSGQLLIASFCTIMICSIMAFLSLNFRRPWQKQALIYLGDAGSTMLGFMLTWLLISSTQGITPAFTPVYALWFLAVPLLDTVNLLIKRPLQGRSPFAAGTDHLHHMLLSRGFSVAQTVLLILGIALACGGIGLLGINLGLNDSTMFQLFIVLFGVYFFLSDRIAKSPNL